jgi:nitric oxide reductase NorD protein
MGPVLRHATRLLERQPGREKPILLITDGRPCDYDTYEGRYGIQD